MKSFVSHLYFGLICFIISECSSGDSVGSSGSQERLADSDSDREELNKGNTQRPPLVSQESETSTDEDQLSPRISLDLSGFVPETIPEQTTGTDSQSDDTEESNTERL